MINVLVDIYFDKKKNVLVIPCWTDEDGIGRSSMKYTKLEAGYSELQLGEVILAALEISEKNEQEEKEQEVCQIAGEVKSWRAFQKKYECVIVDVDKNGIWEVEKQKRYRDGSYGLETWDGEKYTRKFQDPLSAEQLGTVVLEQLKIK